MTVNRILILCTHPNGSAPSQRFRFEQYIPILQKKGYRVDQEPFLDEKTHMIIYSSGHWMKKAFGILHGFLRRLRLIIHLNNHDCVFIHLEACPIGPPFFEWLIFIKNIPIIYDLDDAIFMQRNSKRFFFDFSLKWPSKIKFITSKALKVITVNDYLLKWASKYNNSVTVIPTTIDPNIHKAKRKFSSNTIPVIGWTGTRSTAPYLEIIRPSFNRIQETHEFAFQVICDINPGFDELLNYKYIKWNKNNEINDLLKIDIGVMPVPDIPWTKGKVGFKAIQYGALAIPSVVSNVGSGPTVVNNGITGYVVDNQTEQWCKYLIELIENIDLRMRFGKAASKHIKKYYSTDAQSNNYIKLFNIGEKINEIK